MIEVQPASKYDSCISCGATEDLNQITFRRSSDSNGSIITLCDHCIETLHTKALK